MTPWSRPSTNWPAPPTATARITCGRRSRQYLERQQWQVAAIDEGLADANAGRLLEHTEIEKRWGLQ